MGRTHVKWVPGTLAAGGLFFAAQVAYVVKRDLPTFEGFDASALLGDPSLPLIRVAALGDSTMTGPGLERPDDIWIRQAVQRFSSQYRIELTSVAKGGSRAADVALTQVPLIVASDIAIVTAGSNDALHGDSAQRTERFLRQAVTELLDKSHVVILTGVGELGGIPRLTRPLARMAKARADAMEDVHARVAQMSDRIIKVPIRETAAPRFRLEQDLFAPDLFHVNARGHEIWADALEPSLAEAFRRVANR